MNGLRVAAGLVLILGLVGWTARDVWRNVVKQRQVLKDVKLDIVWYEERCVEVRDQLPASGSVGYRDLHKGYGSDRRHALVQYALVPLIVEWKTNRTPAIEVFQDPRSQLGALFGNVRVVPGGRQ